MVPTDSAPIESERALITSTTSPAPNLAAQTRTTSPVAYSFAALDQEVRSARLQIMRGTQDFVEGHLRLALALSTIRANRLYRDGGYTSYEEYLGQCQGISADTAQRCVEIFESFGPDAFRDLVANVGLMRSYFLALINNMVPQVLEELLTLPQVGGVYAVAMLDTGEWQQAYNELKAQLEEAYTRYEDLADKLAAAQQISTMFKSRFEEQVKMNQSLTVERDKADREVERLGKEVAGKPRRDPNSERVLKQRVKQLEEQQAATQAALDLAIVVPAPTTSAPPALPQPGSTPGDPLLLAEHLRFCATALRRYHTLTQHDNLETEQDFHRALAEVIEQAHISLLMPVMRACATALRAYPPGSPNIPAAATRAFYQALRTLGAAVAAVYPTEGTDAHA